MPLTVSTLFNFTETPFRLKLLAGKQGLSKTVSWIYYTEDPSTIEFIRGGELAVTTCLNIERRKQNEGLSPEQSSAAFLKEFIDCLINHNASGFIINVGKYITTIPHAVLDYCDENNFPLFSMPWEIHTIDLFQEMGNMITVDNLNSQSVENFFYRAIFEKEKFFPEQIENTNFHNAKSFSVALLNMNEDLFDNDIEQIKRYVKFYLNPKMNIPQNDYCCFIHNHKVIYIIKNDDQAFVKELSSVTSNDRYFAKTKFSISDSCSNVNDIKEMFNHAKIAMDLCTADSKICRYEDLGIYKILLDVKNKKVLEQFYRSTLGKLETIETEKRKDYLKTLSLYLKLGGNIQAVSEENYTHRNTVLYRLQRIEELLDIDLSDGDTRCLLQIAIYIMKLVEK